MLTRYFFRRRDEREPSIRGRFSALGRLVRTRPADINPLQASEKPAGSFEAAWRTGIKGRLLLMLFGLVTWAFVLEGRLVQLQVFEHDHLSELAHNQQQSLIKSEAIRGDIVDRRGQMLAYTVEADSIGADPKLVVDAALTAASLCTALRDCTDKERLDLFRKLGGPGRFVYVRRSRQVSPDQAQRVAALDLEGVTFPPGTRRYYPRSELAAHVLGFVDLDNKGQGGIELSYDKVVRGQEGVALARVDARRHRLDMRVEREPETGATLELTLDLRMQYIVERELKAGVEANHAAGGAIIVMDPITGEILALASYPTFNPNIVGRFTDDDRRNRATQDVYEPGSTFKIVTASAAIEEGVVGPTELIDCNPGYITFPGRKPITEAKGHNYGVLSLEDVIVKSSNIGAIKVGLRVGAERLTRYVNRFGFGQALSSDFGGQSRGIWAPASLDQSGLASVSMGYQVSVTPLQMVTAASVIANGGTLVEPHVVRAVIRGDRRDAIAPKALRTVISPSTAATMTTIMEGVTERGTAKTAQIDRYQVAGKTGTAHKVVDGGYSDTAFNASFVGFVPSRKPAYTILVVIDTPRAGSHYGGPVSGPIFKRVAESLLQIGGVMPSIDPAPPILVNVDGPLVPVRPGRDAVSPVVTPVGGRLLMPDVRGLGARDALRALSAAGLSVRIEGDGLVVAQMPLPGEPVESGGSSTISLGRRTPDIRTAGGSR